MGTICPWRHVSVSEPRFGDEASPFQVRVYAGVDPLTGKDRYLTESTTSEREVDKIKTRLLATVDQQRSTPHECRARVRPRRVARRP